VVTYGYKDQTIHDGILKGARWLSDASVAGFSRLVHLVRRPGQGIQGQIESRMAELEQAATEATEAVTDTAEALAGATSKAAKKAVRSAKSKIKA
jgi:hypothetical protein